MTSRHCTTCICTHTSLPMLTAGLQLRLPTVTQACVTIDECRLIVFFVISPNRAQRCRRLTGGACQARPPAPTKNQAAVTSHLLRASALARILELDEQQSFTHRKLSVIRHRSVVGLSSKRDTSARRYESI